MNAQEKYEAALKLHEDRCEQLRPNINDYYGPNADENYRHDMNEWEKMKYMDAPNPPGYTFANND